MNKFSTRLIKKVYGQVSPAIEAPMILFSQSPKTLAGVVNHILPSFVLSFRTVQLSKFLEFRNILDCPEI